MIDVVAWALAAVSVLVLAPAAYLLALALLSRRTPAPPAGPPRLRFDLVVPAHDEEAGIAATVASLLAVDWPPERRRVVVVADNCTDATAARAREAGATVLVRESPLRGKGYALAHAFDWSLADGFADALVVVDADTLVSPNLLVAFAGRLEAGAEAIQAEYGVRNPGASWRTQLMAIAFALFHGVRSRARERLGLSAGLRGNGMCFAAPVLRAVPHQAFSIVEDVEYGIRLGLSGRRVHYAGEALVRGEMPSGAAASRSQRRRWEGGRARLLRLHGAALVGGAVRRRDLVLLDLAVDLLVPPLAPLAAAAGAGTAAAAIVSAVAGRPVAALLAFGAATLALAVYVVRGWWLSGTGLRGLVALAAAPAYLVWKIGVALERPGDRNAWVRTARDGPDAKARDKEVVR